MLPQIQNFLQNYILFYYFFWKTFISASRLHSLHHRHYFYFILTIYIIIIIVVVIYKTVKRVKKRCSHVSVPVEPFILTLQPLSSPPLEIHFGRMLNRNSKLLQNYILFYYFFWKTFIFTFHSPPQTTTSIFYIYNNNNNSHNKDIYKRVKKDIVTFVSQWSLFTQPSTCPLPST